MAIGGVGYLWTSYNRGSSWVVRTNSTSQTWRSLACSANGTYILAAADYGDLYTSECVVLLLIARARMRL